MMERSQTSWGTWDPRNDTEVSFLGLLFASYIPRPRDEEANNLETPTDAYKKKPQGPASSSQRTRKGAAWQMF